MQNSSLTADIESADKNACACCGGAKIHEFPQYLAIDSKLSLADYIGAFKVRMGMGRSDYSVAPGLYSLGNPGRDSVVIVSSNYKLTFDSLRSAIEGLDAWILILDTRGVNVWCAAGKGTFGTEELIRKINDCKLSLVVDHFKLILPQLGASGVAAHEVEKATGFKVIYGPVYASDIKSFIASGYKKDAKMRAVEFGLIERIKVIGVEFVLAIPYLIYIFAAIFILNMLKGRGVIAKTLSDFRPFLIASLSGTCAVPVLLPWLPTRSFAIKGLFAGAISFLAGALFSKKSAVGRLAEALIIPSISSMLALNFTGATTYTAESTTIREVKAFFKPLLISAIAGAFIYVFDILSEKR